MILQRKSFKNKGKSMFDSTMKSAIRAQFIQTYKENSLYEGLTIEEAYGKYMSNSMLDFYIALIDFSVLATLNSKFLGWLWDEKVVCPNGLEKSIKDHLIYYDMLLMFYYNLKQFSGDTIEKKEEFDLARVQEEVDFFKNIIGTLKKMSEFYEIPQEWFEKEKELMSDFVEK